MSQPTEWCDIVKNDFLNLMVGKLLGTGVSRQTWTFPWDERLVVKIENGAQSFQNIVEWETWHNLWGTKWQKYLAPCRAISNCGCVLVQDRVDLLTKEAEQKRLPTFLTDFKRSNYGMLNGRVVCCDYGTNILGTIAAQGSTIKLTKPEWRD